MSHPIKAVCLLSLVLAVGCTKSPSPTESKATANTQQVELQSPLEIEANRAGFESAEAYQRHELINQVTRAEQQRKALIEEMDAAIPDVEEFQRAFSDNESEAVSVDDLAVSFAGKDWIGSGKAKQMSIKVRLENLAERETIRSIVFDMEVYRKGNKSPVSKSSRWMASPIMRTDPTVAVIKGVKGGH